MKNYQNSDYALNKHSGGIVYRFADGIMEVTLENYLAENFGKTEVDFRALKELSDALYLEQVTADCRQTRKDVTIHGLDETAACAAPSAEDEVIERPERAAAEQMRRRLAGQALDTLTAVQRRRYLMFRIDGLNEREIAEQEGSTQQAVSKSLCRAEKKIRKFLSGTKK